MSTQHELHVALNYLHRFQPCKGVVVVGKVALITGQDGSYFE